MRLPYRSAGLLGAGLVLSLSAFAEPAATQPDHAGGGPARLTPTIAGYGEMYALPDAAYQPQKDQVYRVVFALSKGPQKPEEVTPGLDAVARAINLYTAAGVPLDHLKFVAVFYGPATGAALDAAHYKDHFKVDDPDIDLIHKLRAAGVDVVVCGQAYLGQGFPADGLNKEVRLALSALTTITALQAQGYALMPF